MTKALGPYVCSVRNNPGENRSKGQDMAAVRREFRKKLLDQLTPYLETHGFKRWKPSGRDEAPTVYFARHRSSVRDLLDLAFDKYGRLAFFVNLASVKGEWAETMFEGVLPAHQVTTSHLRQGCRLVGGKFSQPLKPTLLSRMRGATQAADSSRGEILRPLCGSPGLV